MGKDAGFQISSRLTGGDLKSENQVFHFAIIFIDVLMSPDAFQLDEMMNNAMEEKGMDVYGINIWNHRFLLRR